MSSHHRVQDGAGIVETIPGYGRLQAYGTTVPADGKSGYAIGCIFHKLNGAAATTFYINEGTATSADFNALQTAATLAGTGGAALVGIADAGSFTAQTTVEAALAELYQDSLSTLAMIPMPLNTWRLTESNDIPAIAVASGNGGNLARDTAPKLIRVSTSTDKAARIQYAANGVIEIQNDFVYPPDLDDTANLIFNMLANMGGASDTPTVAVSYWEGVGDSDAGGNTAAITGTTVAQYTRTITAANVGAYPNKATITLVPAAHGTDVLNIYATWITYKRKLRVA